MVNQAQPHEAEGRFLLTVCDEDQEPNESGGELHEVYLSLDGQGKPGWENLPQPFERGMKNIPEEEQVKCPLDCLRVVANSVGKPENKPPPPIPEQQKFKDEMRQLTEKYFRIEDPSKQYAPMHKLGEGGQAPVYQVERLADKKHFAMKLMTYKNSQEKEEMINEIALMLLNEGQSILGCVDVFDYKARFWIIIELMDGCITDVIMASQQQYSENVCRYILFKSLQGL